MFHGRFKRRKPRRQEQHRPYSRSEQTSSSFAKASADRQVSEANVFTSDRKGDEEPRGLRRAAHCTAKRSDFIRRRSSSYGGTSKQGDCDFVKM